MNGLPFGSAQDKLATGAEQGFEAGNHKP